VLTLEGFCERGGS